MPRKRAICKLGYLALLLFIIVSTNLHLPFLQIIAWSQMFYRYAAVMPMREAAKRTFDLEKPCSLCLAIKRQQIADQTAFKQTDRIFKELYVIPSPERLIHATLMVASIEIPAMGTTPAARTPPHPPPRSPTLARFERV